MMATLRICIAVKYSRAGFRGQQLAFGAAPAKGHLGPDGQPIWTSTKTPGQCWPGVFHSRAQVAPRALRAQRFAPAAAGRAAPAAFPLAAVALGSGAAPCDAGSPSTKLVS